MPEVQYQRLPVAEKHEALQAAGRTDPPFTVRGVDRRAGRSRNFQTRC